MSQGNPKWDDDQIQFPRLLAELRALGLTPEQYAGLNESMDLSQGDIDELLERAEAAWQLIIQLPPGHADRLAAINRRLRGKP